MAEDEKPFTGNGTISTEHTVWCARCAYWEQFPEPTKASTARAARRSGWRLVKDEGWVCGAHKRERSST